MKTKPLLILGGLVFVLVLFLGGGVLALQVLVPLYLLVALFHFIKDYEGRRVELLIVLVILGFFAWRAYQGAGSHLERDDPAYDEVDHLGRY
jgi:hypothetical protein